MSGAADAATALQQATDAAYRSVYRAGARFAQASSAVSAAVDLMDVLRASVDAVVAIEALHQAADDAVATLRETLAATLQETGAMSVAGTHHTAGVSRKAPFVSVSDEGLIPREYFTQPPPALDKRAVKSALSGGAEIPGVSLATPNAMTLVIRAKKEAAVP